MNKAHVLVVDDDRDFAESLADVIEAHGHQVKIAYSGEEAVEYFGVEHFDITLMDMKLPGMNGVQSFARFRELKPDAKVVMMTGYSVEDLIKQAQDEGALAVFQKPIDIDKVLDYIESANPKGGDILLVDDDEDFVQTTEEFLRQSGYRVAVALNGEQAIEKIQAGNVKGLLLDLRMPVMSGLEVYLQLKKQGQALPTIIMTAYRTEEIGQIDAFQSIEKIGYLFKPFKPDELIKLIESIISREPRE